jgi:DNA-binding protein
MTPGTYRVSLLLVLGAIGLLAGVTALVAIAATGIAIERAVAAYRTEQERDELAVEVERLRPLAQICEIQTTTAQLLLGASHNSRPNQVGDGASAEIAALPTIEELEDRLRGSLDSPEESRS